MLSNHGTSPKDRKSPYHGYTCQGTLFRDCEWLDTEAFSVEFRVLVVYLKDCAYANLGHPRGPIFGA